MFIVSFKSTEPLKIKLLMSLLASFCAQEMEQMAVIY